MSPEGTPRIGRVETVATGLCILRVDGERLVAAAGYRILRSEDGGATWNTEGRVTDAGLRQAVAGLPLLRRITRGGVSFHLPLPDGSRLAVIAGGIVKAAAGSTDYRRVQRVRSGSRPLNLCALPDGTVFWGDYFLNLRRREPVLIHASDDLGRSWRVAHAFPAGTVCHVHRIIHDPWDGVLYVCTGDRDHESLILRTPDRFATLERLAGGSQEHRTATLVPRPADLLYGTDHPGGRNFIMTLDRRSGRAEPIQEIPGPAIHACRAGSLVAFATMVERRQHEASLWVGDGSTFREAARFRVRKGIRLWRELAGYSTMILPEGTGAPGFVYGTPVGTVDHAEEIIRIALDSQADGGAGEARC